MSHHIDTQKNCQSVAMNVQPGAFEYLNDSSVHHVLYGPRLQVAYIRPKGIHEARSLLVENVQALFQKVASVIDLVPTGENSRCTVASLGTVERHYPMGGITINCNLEMF